MTELLQTIRNSAEITIEVYKERNYKLHTDDGEHGVDGGVSEVPVLRPEVRAGLEGVEVGHVGGDEDGGEDIAEDEDTDDGQQGVHTVLKKELSMVRGKVYRRIPDDVRGGSYEMVCPFHHF